MTDKAKSVLSKLSNPIQLIGFLISYRLKEILAIIILLLVSYIVIFNVNYSDKTGIEIKATDIKNIKCK